MGLAEQKELKSYNYEKRMDKSSFSLKKNK